MEKINSTAKLDLPYQRVVISYELAQISSNNHLDYSSDCGPSARIATL